MYYEDLIRLNNEKKKKGIVNRFKIVREDNKLYLKDYQNSKSRILYLRHIGDIINFYKNNNAYISNISVLIRYHVVLDRYILSRSDWYIIRRVLSNIPLIHKLEICKRRDLDNFICKLSLLKRIEVLFKSDFYQVIYIVSSKDVLIVTDKNLIVNDATEFTFRELGNIKHVIISNIQLANEDLGEKLSLASLFYDCSELESVVFNKFNTNLVQTFDSMFSNCKKLRYIDVSCFDTSSVKTMNFMFENCSSLESLDLNNFDTRQVLGMSGMFISCTKLKTLHIVNWCYNINCNLQGIFYHTSCLENINLKPLLLLCKNDLKLWTSMFKGSLCEAHFYEL